MNTFSRAAGALCYSYVPRNPRVRRTAAGRLHPEGERNPVTHRDSGSSHSSSITADARTILTSENFTHGAIVRGQGL